MTGYLLGNFLIYCVVNAFTPGPGNVLTLSTVTSYGLRRGMPTFLAICLGYSLVHTICALFVYGVGSLLPRILVVMKYVGVAYILWLAIHIARSRPQDVGETEQASFTKGLALQCVNPKIYFFSITCQTAYVTAADNSLPFMLGAALVMGFINWIATFTWAGLGALIQSFYIRHYRPLNIIMALALLECVYSILTAQM